MKTFTIYFDIIQKGGFRTSHHMEIKASSKSEACYKVNEALRKQYGYYPDWMVDLINEY